MIRIASADENGSKCYLDEIARINDKSIGGLVAVTSQLITVVGSWRNAN